MLVYNYPCNCTTVLNICHLGILRSVFLSFFVPTERTRRKADGRSGPGNAMGGRRRISEPPRKTVGRSSLLARPTKSQHKEPSERTGYELIARLLSLELFILGVQAKKLHFCNLELILNKTGYSHIMENKKIFFIF